MLLSSDSQTGRLHSEKPDQLVCCISSASPEFSSLDYSIGYLFLEAADRPCWCCLGVVLLPSSLLHLTVIILKSCLQQYIIIAGQCTKRTTKVSSENVHSTIYYTSGPKRAACIDCCQKQTNYSTKNHLPVMQRESSRALD